VNRTTFLDGKGVERPLFRIAGLLVKPAHFAVCAGIVRLTLISTSSNEIPPIPQTAEVSSHGALSFGRHSLESVLARRLTKPQRKHRKIFSCLKSRRIDLRRRGTSGCPQTGQGSPASSRTLREFPNVKAHAPGLERAVLRPPPRIGPLIRPCFSVRCSRRRCVRFAPSPSPRLRLLIGPAPRVAVPFP
jgi:hypothetical protein